MLNDQHNQQSHRSTNGAHVFLTHYSSNHSSYSGQSRIVDYFNSTLLSGYEPSLLPWHLRKQLAAARHSSMYNTLSISKELLLFSHMVKHRDGLAHFLHGEHDFYWTGYWAKYWGWQTVATFHAPPFEMRERLGDAPFLKRLDGACCVGTNQIDYLRSLVGHDKVWFIPHGIDVDFFVPNANQSYTQSCLFVGSHLRDFSSLGRVAKIIEEKFKEVCITVVAPADKTASLPAIPPLVCKNGLSDEALRAEYQSAALLLLPLIDATACNSLLEAMACGLPVVTTDVGGVRDYVDDTCAIICPPNDIDSLVDAVTLLLKDTAINLQMRQAARQKAMQFSWPRVRTLLIESYQTQLGFVLAD